MAPGNVRAESSPGPESGIYEKEPIKGARETVPVNIVEKVPAPAGVGEFAQGKPVSLDDCILMAFKKHPLLRYSFALRDGAEAQIVQVRSAYYPTVSFSSTYRRSVSKVARTSEGITLPTVVNKSDYYNSAVSINQLLYDFGRTGYRVLSASENLKAANYDILKQADQIILEIREAYFKSVAAEKALDVQLDTVRQQELHLKQAQGFYEIGRRSKIEVTKAQVDLSDAKLDLIRAENNVKLARVSLANKIGLDGNFDYVLDDSVRLSEVKMDEKTAISYARTRRPEMLKYDSLEKIRNAGLGLAKAAYYPSLSTSGSFGYGDNQFVFRDYSWGWGLSLHFDIYTAGERAGAVQEARQNLLALLATKDRAWQDIYLEVKAALLALEEARNSIDALEKTLDEARENFALAQGRYEVGLSDNLEFNDARILFQKAKLNLISAILDYQIARARLEKATGTTVVAIDLMEQWKKYPDSKIEPMPGER